MFERKGRLVGIVGICLLLGFGILQFTVTPAESADKPITLVFSSYLKENFTKSFQNKKQKYTLKTVL